MKPRRKVTHEIGPFTVNVYENEVYVSIGNAYTSFSFPKETFTITPYLTDGGITIDLENNCGEMIDSVYYFEEDFVLEEDYV